MKNISTSGGLTISLQNDKPTPGFDNSCMRHTYICLRYRYVVIIIFLHTWLHTLFHFCLDCKTYKSDMN